MFIVYIAKVNGKKSFVGPFNDFDSACQYVNNMKNHIEQKYNVHYYTPSDGWCCSDFNTLYLEYNDLPDEFYVHRLTDQYSFFDI